MDTDLSNLELRVIGCLMEKAATTPDAYPLTLNSLTNACNQKTNRDPVMDLAEQAVQSAAESLQQRGLVSTRSGAGNSRVTKYSHRLGKKDLLFEAGFDEAELAVLSVLFLRGPQTLAEIKTRTNRLHAFADLDAVSTTIKKLEENSKGPYVRMLARQTGHKEPRCTHLFGANAGEAAAETQTTRSAAPASTPEAARNPADSNPADSTAADSTDTGTDTARIFALEQKVDELSKVVRALKESLGDL